MSRTYAAGAVLLALLLTAGDWAEAQTISGSVIGTVVGGWRTNTYLDPGIRTWRSPDRPAFVDLRPSASLTWDGPSSRVRAAVSGLSGVFSGPEREPPRMWTGQLSGTYVLGPRWTVGALGGRRSIRFGGRRTTDWLAARLGWHPGNGLTVTAQPAWAGQTVVNTYGHVARYRSWTGLLRTTYWPSARWRIRVSGYLTDTAQPSGTTEYTGTGGEVGVRFRPSVPWSVGLSAGVQDVGYRFSEGGAGLLAPAEAGRRLAEVGLTVRRQLTEEVQIFADGRLLRFRDRSGAEAQGLDTRIGGGVRVSLGRTLWRRSDGRRPDTRIWRSEDERLHLEVSYRGSGRLYLTGSFNQWAEPGRPLRRTGRGTYTLTLELPPGRYEYAIRVVGENDREWLDLPDGVPSVEDGFGRENGILYVRHRETERDRADEQEAGYRGVGDR